MWEKVPVTPVYVKTIIHIQQKQTIFLFKDVVEEILLRKNRYYLSMKKKTLKKKKVLLKRRGPQGRRWPYRGKGLLGDLKGRFFYY